MQEIRINVNRSKGAISKNIYGHFSEHLGRCVYQGLFVGKDSPIPNENGMRRDVVDALRRIRVPVLRWPGGCFADEYHWQDGVGPQEGRKRMVNTNWGYVVEDNSFGTHEFMELCRQIGCAPYINGNVGSGTVREMAEWVEYLNSDGDSTVVRQRWANGHREPFHVKYWAVGNESWGCGGNMRPEYYADEYRRYQTYCRNYGDDRLYRIACGPSDGDYNWTEVLMRQAGRYMDGLSLHYYTVCGDSWAHKGSATQFTSRDYYHTLAKAWKMEELVSGHSRIMDRYDPEKRVGLVVDEWGTWYDVEPGTNPGFLYQQNTMRDAMVAAITLNIFNHHCDRVAMANLAQTVNVLQAVILTDGDRMTLTPTYHVFDLFKGHQDAKELDCAVSGDVIGEGADQIASISASASEKDGRITLTLAHVRADQAREARLRLEGCHAGRVTGRMLQGDMLAFNDFDHAPLAVTEYTDFCVEKEEILLRLPPCAVVTLEIEKA